MRAYILTVVGAAVMSAFAAVMAPKTWQKYVQLVTGVVIITAITAPVIRIVNSDFSFKIPSVDAVSEDGAELNKNLVVSELTKRIEEDIEKRLYNDYNIYAKARVRILVNDKNEIEGVEEIRITEGKITNVAKQKLCEIYGVDMVYER